MQHTNIIDADLQLVAQLAARKLKDGGVDGLTLPKIWKNERNFGILSLWNARYDFDGMPAVVQFSWSAGDNDFDKIVETATELAGTVERLWEGRDETAVILDDVKREAKRLVANAVRRKVPWRLLKIELEPVMVWEDFDLSPRVTIEMLDDALRPTKMSFICESAEELASCLEENRQSQKLLAERKSIANSVGATTIIDGVTYAALQRTGLDVATFVRGLGGDFGRSHHDVDGRSCSFFFKEGILGGRIQLSDDAVWEGGWAVIKKSAALMRKPRAALTPLSKLIKSPLFDDRTTVQVAKVHPKELALLCARVLVYFDEVSGEVKFTS